MKYTEKLFQEKMNERKDFSIKNNEWKQSYQDEMNNKIWDVEKKISDLKTIVYSLQRERDKVIEEREKINSITYKEYREFELDVARVIYLLLLDKIGKFNTRGPLSEEDINKNCSIHNQTVYIIYPEIYNDGYVTFTPCLLSNKKPSNCYDLYVYMKGVVHNGVMKIYTKDINGKSWGGTTRIFIASVSSRDEASGRLKNLLKQKDIKIFIEEYEKFKIKYYPQMKENSLKELRKLVTPDSNIKEFLSNCMAGYMRIDEILEKIQ